MPRSPSWRGACASRSDEILTQGLRSALALIDVRMLDHFIVGRTHVVSLAERGLM